MKKTIYVLRTRENDSVDWREPAYFRKRSERDRAEKYSRLLGGLRTYRYEEKKTAEEIEELITYE